MFRATRVIRWVGDVDVRFTCMRLVLVVIVGIWRKQIPLSWEYQPRGEWRLDDDDDDDDFD